MPDADRRAARRPGPALQPVPRHRTVLADPPGADDRAQPPLGRDGRDVGDGHRRARLHRLPARERRDDRPDPERQRLQHRRLRQVAPDASGRGERVRAVHPLAHRRGLRPLLRLHGRGDEPLVPAAVRRHHPRRAGPAAGGRIPPHRGPGGPRRGLGDRDPRAHAGQAVLRLPGPRRHARAVPRRARVDREVRRRVRRRLGRAARTDPGAAEAARARAARRASSRPGPRGSRTGTSWTRSLAASPPGSWRPTRGSPSTPTTRSAGSSTGCTELGVLDDTLVLYLLGDNGASGEGGPAGTVREHLVGHGFADDVAAMDARPRPDRRPDDVRDLPGRLGAGHEHAVPVDQAGRLTLRWDAGRAGRALAGRDRRARGGAPPVPPRDRRAADHPGRGRAAGAGDRGRRPAAAGRGYVDALLVRRPRGRRNAAPRSTSRWSATEGSTTRDGPR